MSTPSPQAGADWPAKIADQIEHVVQTVRDRTTRPIITAGRALVYGLLAGVLLVLVIVLLSITIIRVLTILTDHAWVAYAITGGLYSLVGILLLVRRRPPTVAAP
jgi:hypothetical protein